MIRPRLRRLALARGFAVAAVAGMIAGVVLLVLDVLVFSPLLPRALAADAGRQVTPWMGLLATLYGAIDEEVLLRFGVMTLLAWAFSWLVRGSARASNAVTWLAIVGAAALFGAGHLPATAAIVPLSQVVIARAILLNGVAGILYGWLYWRQGLALAMVAHGGTDIVLHVLTPMMAGRA